MKRSILILLSSGIFSFFVNQTSSFSQEFPDAFKFLGPVKSCHLITSYASTNEDGEVVPIGINFQTKIVYDDQGRWAQTTYFTWVGDNYSAVQEVCEYIYEANKWIGTMCRDSNGILLTRWEYFHDSFGNDTTVISYNSDLVETYKRQMVYDQAGLIRCEVKFEYGLKVDSTSYTYNSNAQCISISNFSQNSSQIFHSVENSYDESGRIAERIIKSGDYNHRYLFSYTNGQSISSFLGDSKYPYQVQYFDKDSNEIKVINYSKKKKVESEITRQFDSDGKLIAEEYESGDTKEIKTFTYDEHGNVIQLIVTGTDGMNYSTTWRYTYDNYGNWVKYIEFSPNGVAQHITIRELTYF